MSGNEQLSIENLVFIEDEMDEYGEPLNNVDEDDSDNDDLLDTIDLDEEDADTEDEDEDEGYVDEDEEDSEPEDDTDSKKQSAEQNAYYAEQRRLKQAEEKVRAELESQRQSSPEYKMAQTLAKQYGISVEELAKQIEDSALERQADEQGVSVEYLRELQAEREARQALEEKLNKLEFDSWYSQKQSEKEQVKSKFNNLVSDQEIDDALIFVLENFKRTDISLEKAVRIMHGDKIENELKRIAKQEALAEISGRKQSPLAPQSGKASSSESLTSEERYIAKRMGLTEEEYQKYKS